MFPLLWIVPVVIITLYLFSSIKILSEYERGLVFRLGRVLTPLQGPGLALVFAPLDRLVRMSDALNNPKCHPGDAVVLAEGPHQYVHGIFLGLQEDLEWGAIQQSNGVMNSHPVEGMQSDQGPNSSLSS